MRNCLSYRGVVDIRMMTFLDGMFMNCLHFPSPRVEFCIR